MHPRRHFRPISYAASPVGTKHPSDILALPHPDWIGQTVTFTGAAEKIAALKEAAAGSGIVPWIIDYTNREEDFFHWLAAPKNGWQGYPLPRHTLWQGNCARQSG